MNRLTFVSGWAGHPDLFPRLSQAAQFLHSFVLQTPEEIQDALRAGEGEMLVGWSTGAHLVLKDLPELSKRYEQIVLIAPFYQYTRCLYRSTVLKMIENFDKNPVRTVRAFYRTCGVRGADASWCEAYRDELRAGLEFLLDSEAVFAPDKEYPHVLVLAGLSDQIVPVSEAVEIAGKLPRAQYRALTTGHYVPEEELEKSVEEATGRSLF